jgi:vacuolar protein sorting-associated protein 45
VHSIGGKFTTTFNGVENVYTQHKPLLSSTLTSLAAGKLKDSTFPAALSNSAGGRLTEVVIFIMGGATYEEAKCVTDFNKENPSMRVILGGSCIHNSRSFLHEVSQI